MHNLLYDLACKVTAGLQVGRANQDQSGDQRLAWEEACRRDDVIRALLAGAGKDGRIGRLAIASASAELKISPATLYRLLARFRTDRRVSVLRPTARGPKPGSTRLSATLESLIRDEIRDFYLKPERPTFQALLVRIHALCASQGLPKPTGRTVQRRLEQIDARKRARARGDDARLEALTATPGQQVTERPLEFVQIDHTRVDVVVVDEHTREPIGRPWLTLGVDVCSRMTTGFSLSFEPPSLTSVSLCLLHSVFDKSAWLQQLGVDVSWPVVGLPKRIGVDNAAEFRSAQFETACREFGIKVEYRPRGAKHFGGHIERLIGTQMGAVQVLPETTHGSIISKQSYEPEAAAALTLQELETWMALEIAGHYHQRVHSSLNRPPIAVWRDWEEELEMNLPSDRLAFWVSFLPGEARTLQRDGIHLFNICYWSNALRGDVGQTKDKLTVRYDPRNISRVFVERANGHWIEARYRNLKWPAISLWEHAAALRALRRQGRREVNEAVLFDTVLRQRELVAKAVSNSAAARLAKHRMPASVQSGADTAVSAQAKARLTGIDLSKSG
jgi:putative transposase